MNKIEIYTKPFCHRAKALLDSQGAQYTEIDVSIDANLQPEKMERSQRKTVPQIFIDDQHIGGSDDLMRVHHTGELDKLLAQHRRKHA